MASPKEVLAMEDKEHVIVRFVNRETNGLRERRKDELTRLFNWKGLIIRTSGRFPHDPVEAVKLFDELVAEDGATIVEINLPATLLHAIFNNSEFMKRGGKIIRPRFLPGSESDFTHLYEEFIKVDVVTQLL